MGRGNAYRVIDLKRPVEASASPDARTGIVKPYLRPSVRVADATDGTSSTLTVGERSFEHAESSWVGAVTAANRGPTAGSPLPTRSNNASNFVPPHTGGATSPSLTATSAT